MHDVKAVIFMRAMGAWGVDHGRLTKDFKNLYTHITKLSGKMEKVMHDSQTHADRWMDTRAHRTDIVSCGGVMCRLSRSTPLNSVRVISTALRPTFVHKRCTLPVVQLVFSSLPCPQPYSRTLRSRRWI
jgi:hypothetical protein